MAGGDGSLGTVCVASLGPAPGAVMALRVGGLLGSAVGRAALVIQRRRTALPCGPPLAVGAAAVALWGEVLAPWWR